MAITDMDLEIRSRQMHRVHLTLAAIFTAAGVLMMITIALLPIGLIVFLLGLVWLAIVIVIGRADRNQRETQRGPSER